jgi:hypothetical protein
LIKKEAETGQRKLHNYEIRNLYPSPSIINAIMSRRVKWAGHIVVLEVKVKLSLCFNSAQRHEGVLGEWLYNSTHSLTSALDGDE